MPRKAFVKFLTPESCLVYFDATSNGVIIPGTKNTVLVEKTPGPNSVNDLVRNCTDGDATRCVRAYDADDDWSDALLLGLAKGKGQPKREVDCVKQGRTAGVSR